MVHLKKPATILDFGPIATDFSLGAFVSEDTLDEPSSEFLQRGALISCPKKRVAAVQMAQFSISFQCIRVTRVKPSPDL